MSNENYERRLYFSTIKWLNTNEFNSHLKRDIEITPNIRNDKNVSVFIGKTADQHETIGVVSLNETNEWILSVIKMNTIIVMKHFYVMNIEDGSDSISWSKYSQQKLPFYAIGASIIDTENYEEYAYIGKCNLKHQTKFGIKVKSKNDLMVPFQNNIIEIKDYDILCLKPSPAYLKTLCCLTIQKMNSFSNKNIENINLKQKCLPDSLIVLLKYPSYLTTGQCLLKGDKIVRNDGRFEMFIDKFGNLICQSLPIEENNELDGEKQMVKRIIKTGVNSIWLHNYKIVFSSHGDNRIKCCPVSSSKYKFFISSDSEIPRLKTESLL
jgi:hypothetical protein